MINHRHLLVNAKINNLIDIEQQGLEFIKFLVDQININIIEGPFVNNSTVAVILKNSHIAFNIINEPIPCGIQFDIYTWENLDIYKIMKAANKYFDIQETSSVRMLGRHECNLCLIEKIKPGWIENYLQNLELNGAQGSDIPWTGE